MHLNIPSHALLRAFQEMHLPKHPLALLGREQHLVHSSIVSFVRKEVGLLYSSFKHHFKCLRNHLGVVTFLYLERKHVSELQGFSKRSFVRPADCYQSCRKTMRAKLQFLYPVQPSPGEGERKKQACNTISEADATTTFPSAIG